MDITIDEALSHLRDAGLFAQRIKGKEQEIIGGVEGKTNENSELTLKGPFMIFFDGTWIALIRGRGQHNTPIPASTLLEAVAIILELHKKGNLIPKKD